MKDISSKKIIIFDLDGTLTVSKSVMDNEMSDLISGLLTKKKIAVIGGGSWMQFRMQLIKELHCLEELLDNLYLFPTTATCFYRYQHKDWVEVYADVLDPKESKKIKDAFEEVFKKLGYKHPEKVYGEIVEDRRTQISFSPLGQKAPVAEKEKWRASHETKRQEIASALRKIIPEVEVRTGGLTTIDVTKKGIDKAYGIRQIENLLGIPIKQMLFVGDALYPGGNDFAAIEAGVETIAVDGPEDTKKLIGEWIK